MIIALVTHGLSVVRVRGSLAHGMTARAQLVTDAGAVPWQGARQQAVRSTGALRRMNDSS